jgi:S-adenosylmethionine:tRNA ribosyltransferase-isomerase
MMPALAAVRTLPAKVPTALDPARAPRDAGAERLLVIDALSSTLSDARLTDLPSLLAPGDLLVVNDAATLPASLFAETSKAEPLDLRLARALPSGAWQVVLFGAGDWRTPTEARAAPPLVRAGDRLSFAGEWFAEVSAVDDAEPRLVTLEFDRRDADLWQALYAAGRPVQYAYLGRPLALWDVQSRFASRPWAVEPASAGRPLTWDTLGALRRRGVALASVTHAAGLSSTGSANLDARLPLPERFEIPERTAAAVAATRARGGRVVAAGTTVVRALEAQAARGDGALEAGAGEATLRLGPDSRLRVADAILTGLHEPGSSHFELLEAFAPREVLLRALTHARAAGYLAHEFGDAMLVTR